jgi:hypothetical protein
VADALRKEPGLDVQLIDGAKGEFAVQVDGREVAHEGGESLPSADEVVNAVRKAPQPAGATD